MNSSANMCTTTGPDLTNSLYSRLPVYHQSLTGVIGKVCIAHMPRIP